MSSLLSAGARFGSYQLLSALGEGSFGEVHLAVHTVLRRRAALKVLRTDHELNDEVKEDFLREARLIASLHHPRIVEVYDAGEIDGRLFLALRYFPGGTLEEQLRRDGPLAERRTLELIRDVAEGLQAIEQLGMVHRDVKPSNILLDEAGHGALADLGTVLLTRDVPVCDALAHLTPRSLDRALVGTPAYLAPELYEQQAEASVLTDLYALGVTLYVCLTGELPYAAKNLMQLLMRVVTRPFPDVRQRRPDLDRATIDLLARLTAREPQDRFQNADEVVGAVSTLLGEPTLPYRAPRNRASLVEVGALAERLGSNALLSTVLDALPSPSLVLNASRQVVAANRKALEFLGGEASAFLGKRPGEAFGCVEAAHGSDGCGTAANCRLCGLGRAVSDAGQGCPLPLERLCHVTTDGRAGREAIDVQARITSLPVASGDTLYLVALTDLSDSLRRRLIEGVFFREMLTAADSVRDLSAEIRGQVADPESGLGQLSGRLIRSAEDLLDQVVYQHQAIAAEQGDLHPIPENSEAAGLVQWVADWCQSHPSPRRVRVRVRPGEPYLLRTDTMLLRRALTTLLDSEREGLPEGGEIVIGHDAPRAERICFWLRHAVVLSPEERMRLFKREAPTTSRHDRGPSTSLARLLVERYLHGTLQVESEAPVGTCYRLEVPTRLNGADPAPD